MMWKTTQARVTLLLISFFVILLLVTFVVIKQFVSPQIIATETRNIRATVELQSDAIKEQMNRVKAQQRTITELVSGLQSDQIDALLPLFVNQYGDLNVFGGGIWPLPGLREPGRDKFSTFYARDASGVLQLNTVWNQPESEKYWEQPWYKDGMAAPKGECAWAKAYQDSASPQPRTNCAMTIWKEGKAWGVATIDVTLGFFNQLAKEMGKAVEGTVLIVESDGKIVGNGAPTQGNTALMNVRDLNIPSALPLLNLLSQGQKAEYEGGYDGEDGAHSLFVLSIEGSPWYLVIDTPSSNLVRQSNAILTTLTLVQTVIGLIIVLVLMLIVRNIFRNVTLLNRNIEALSGGGADLTQRLVESKSPEFNAIINNFNKFIAFLQDLMQQVGHSSSAISSASRQIAGGNLDLSSRTEEQSASIVETAASMEQLTSTVRQNAENALQANRLATQASDAAKAGASVVNDVVATMSNINDSSSKVVEIISVIDGIAFQTNILALNAAVEAARAGENGRGFAVVAGEVRSLAQRSAQSAQEIKKLIEESVSSIEQGSGLVRQAGTTMDGLMEKVEDVSVLISEISSSSDEQSRGIEQINIAITQLDSATQQNAALVEEVAAAAQSMESQTEMLEKVVGSFKL
ncbi:TPA: methyl-accepting chemotaxis protein [Citrobacter koseri]|uniref:methyl-accepting chemotaxis protein n=1 Tax=Citrobacter TaxID=544 RepID=UPI000E052E2F|nr:MULTISPECIES: methyl-accepting chemotaxis protein [Citrobacter]MCE5352150.1 methyl-accepting chemotaxis protein [Citrobacter koseri]MDM3025639.1 methyl-accepting chemotaxis protein [Citrobacter sp. CK194]STB73411.1 methyl-accepting chemotaxis protein II (aspartate chemoreceptor protein) [Citrobacter koseri]STT23589.1 methyl-accepting chemotaxis protein [Citrobacter koseri]HCB2603350.1 methyl-accepting chemotaxis protein [Citrobacter koseri]